MIRSLIKSNPRIEASARRKRDRALGARRTIDDASSIALEFAQDFARTLRFAAPSDGGVRTSAGSRTLECQVTKDFHRIEKGLALNAPKQPFGEDPERRLRELLAADSLRGSRVAGLGADSIRALKNWNEGGDIDDTVAPPGPEIRPMDRADLVRFFTTRHSVRNYDPERPVDREVLLEAASMAQASPSVCNRQASTVVFVTDRGSIDRVLELQNGNAGFREEVQALGVIAVDSRLFSGAGERNQKWIDGGMFAMTLDWALHGLGVSTCFLNWSVSNARSRELRRLLSMPAELDVIALVAMGYARAGHRVARSERRPLNEVVSFWSL